VDARHKAGHDELRDTALLAHFIARLDRLNPPSIPELAVLTR
jgi:hypothetical protein